MYSSSDTLIPPSANPESYCRFCLSEDGIRAVTPSSKLAQQNIVPLANRQIGVLLVPDEDFPCAMCRTCQEKLEELYLYNFDGLLDEYNDEDLVKFKRSCREVDSAIRRMRGGNGTVGSADKRVVLPFHQISDGRYKCNVCPNEIFEVISACIKHYQEIHPVSTLVDIVAEPDNSAMQGNIAARQSFNCVTCSASFNNIDDLITHREIHARVQPVESISNISMTLEPFSSMAMTSSMIQPIVPSKWYITCICCSQIFDSIHALLTHRGSHRYRGTNRSTYSTNIWLNDPSNITPNNAYKCPHCDQSFIDPKTYYFHLNVSHNTNMCDQCGDSYNAPSVLVKHQAGHRAIREGNFNCVVCLERFETPQEMEEHTLNHQTLLIETVEESQNLTTCGECFVMFETSEDLAAHISTCPGSMVDGGAVLILPDDDPMGGEAFTMISDDEI